MNFSGDYELERREKPNSFPQAEWYAARIFNYLVSLGALWKRTSIADIIGNLSETLWQDCTLDKFSEAVTVRAVEKGWPAPQKGDHDER